MIAKNKRPKIRKPKEAYGISLRADGNIIEMDGLWIDAFELNGIKRIAKFFNQYIAWREFRERNG